MTNSAFPRRMTRRGLLKSEMAIPSPPRVTTT